MDRFIIKEPRNSNGQPTEQTMYSRSVPSRATGCNNDPVYCNDIYGNEFNNINAQYGDAMNSGFRSIVNTGRVFNQGIPFTIMPAPNVSGIDPNYLAAYAPCNASYIIGGDDNDVINKYNGIHSTTLMTSDYQNRNFIGPQRIRQKSIAAFNKVNSNLSSNSANTFTVQTPIETSPNTSLIYDSQQKNYKSNNVPQVPQQMGHSQNSQLQFKNKSKVVEAVEGQAENIIISKADKLKALYKTGSRVYTGPIEKILKWHKSLQEIGLLVLYEIVAKCVNVRPGDGCVKHLVVRDESGPAMQIFYYEIEFLLPELKLPCMIRFQGFSVRAASGDDVATAPRRAAASAHHVHKLCREYGLNN